MSKKIEQICTMEELAAAYRAKLWNGVEGLVWGKVREKYKRDYNRNAAYDEYMHDILFNIDFVITCRRRQFEK